MGMIITALTATFKMLIKTAVLVTFSENSVWVLSSCDKTNEITYDFFEDFFSLSARVKKRSQLKFWWNMVKFWSIIMSTNIGKKCQNIKLTFQSCRNTTEIRNVLKNWHMNLHCQVHTDRRKFRNGKNELCGHFYEAFSPDLSGQI